MTATLPCPHCHSANPAGQAYCGACGTRLVGSEVSSGQPRGALWLDTGTPPMPDTLPGPLVVTLRNVDKQIPPPPPPPSKAVPAPPELVGHPDDLPVTSPHADSRAARRAAVRRALRRAQQAAGDIATEVLVYDLDPEARMSISVWLAAFGFTLHAVEDIGQAWAVASTRKLAAAFVDIVFDDSDGGAGIELCKRVKLASRQRRDARPPLLVLVSRRLAPVEQVTAQLAGCDDYLSKPVSRGAVAGVLDKHGVPMPADSRQA